MTDEKNILEGPPEFEIPDISFGDYVLQSLKQHGDDISQIDGLTGQTATYNEILQKSVNLAESLRRMGIKKGDAVCICSENRFEFIVTAYAVFYIGAVVSTLNSGYSKDEMVHVLKLSKPRLIFCSPSVAKTVQDHTKGLNFIDDLILYGNDRIIKATLYNDLIAKKVDVNSFTTTKVDPANDTLVILASSGTTGLPKGVMLTHRNFVITSENLRIGFEITGKDPTTVKVFLIMPWFHAYGFVTATILSALNAKIIFAKKFEEESYLRIIQDQKVTIAVAAPPIVLFLAKHPLVDKFDLSSLEELKSGSAPLSREIELAVLKRLKLNVVNQAYGMTETTLGTLMDISNGEKPGTVGMVVPGTKAKVVDLKTGEALGPNQEGELCFKSGLLMKGYINNEAATNEMFKNGWMHTGDIAYYDDDGFFFIVDRIKELIKYKGFQVPPAELEAVLNQHQGVRDSAVIGIPDESAGELPLAYVVKQPRSSVTAKEIEDFIASKVSSPKRLRGGVRFIDEIPRNSNGKILRRELRDLYKKTMQSKL